MRREHLGECWRLLRAARAQRGEEPPYHADSRLVATQKTIHTVQDFSKLRHEEKALPTYRAVLRKASQEQGSATDAEVRSGWSQLVAAAQVRIHGASVVNAAFSDNAITTTEEARIGRVSKQVDAQNRRWKTVANRLNTRFEGCRA